MIDASYASRVGQIVDRRNEERSFASLRMTTKFKSGRSKQRPYRCQMCGAKSVIGRELRALTFLPAWLRFPLAGP